MIVNVGIASVTGSLYQNWKNARFLIAISILAARLSVLAPLGSHYVNRQRQAYQKTTDPTWN